MTKTYLEKNQVLDIIDSVSKVSKHKEQDVLILRLMWETGARVTEAITLVPEHIGKESSSVVLKNLKQYKIIKGENKKKIRVLDTEATKTVQVSADLCMALRNFCESTGIYNGEFVFKAPRGKGHASAWYIWNLLDKVSKVAHVEVFGKKHPKTGGRYKGAYPHLFRHSNAMLLLEETRDITLVKEQLGHASIRTTQEYAYATEPRIKRAVKNIDWYKRSGIEEKGNKAFP